MVQKVKKTVSKKQFWSDFQKIKQWIGDYWYFIENLPLDIFSEDKHIIEHLKDQHHSLIQTSVKVDILEMMSALIDLALRRIQREDLVFEIPVKENVTTPDYQDIVGLAKQIKDMEQSLQRLVEQVMFVARHLPGDDHKLVRILETIGSLFKAIIRQDGDDIKIELNQINLLTSTKDSYLLVEEIGKVTREIYNSLQDISSNLDTGDIQMATDEMPDAVQKLYSVIQRLEDATNDNLDFLENLLQQCEENIKLAEGITLDCEYMKAQLSALEKKHPELKEEIRPLVNIVDDNLYAKTEKLLKALHEDDNSYITIMSNQGFQDLTGQTLKKIIDFMEKLELRLLNLIQSYSQQFGDKMFTGEEKKGSDMMTKRDIGVENEEIKLHGPDETDTKKSNQSDVDSLLAEMGF